MKKGVCFLLLCISLFLFSCAGGERLEVVSDDFPKLRYLEAGDFNESMVEGFLDPAFELTNMYYVSEKDGLLCLYNGIDDYYDYRDSHLLHLNGTGYFVGINMGEFGGWLRYYEGKPYDNTDEGVLVSESNCWGYQKVDYGKFYSFVGDVAHLNCLGRTEIYLMEYIDKQWNWKSIADIDGAYSVSCYDEDKETLFVVTLTGIYAIDNSGKLSSYSVNEYFDELAPNSIIVIDDVLYIGSWCGIYAQPVDGSASTWYPLSPS